MEPVEPWPQAGTSRDAQAIERIAALLRDRRMARVVESLRGHVPAFTWGKKVSTALHDYGFDDWNVGDIIDAMKAVSQLMFNDRSKP